MSHASFAVRLVGNLAALAALVLLVDWGIDYATRWFGYPSHAFCTLLYPVITIACEIVVVIGIIMLVVSFGKSESGLTLVIGGFLLFLLPLVLPRYLGVTRIPLFQKISRPRFARAGQHFPKEAARKRASQFMERNA